MKIIGKQADQIRVWQKMSKKLVQFWNKILWTDMTIYTVHTYIMRGGIHFSVSSQIQETQ